jgi:hypothetical protein
MKRIFRIIAILAAVMVFGLAVGCGSSPASQTSGSESRTSDANGNLLVANRSGVELAIYVDRGYKKTAKPGERLSILIDYAEDSGTKVDVEVFRRDRLDNVETYPTDDRAIYYSFPKVVRPLGSPVKAVPINIPQLTQEELASNAGVGNVLVQFSYNDYPQVNSTAEVFTGSSVSKHIIASLENGETWFSPMPVGLNPINIEYSLGGAGRRSGPGKAYPQTQTQRNDDRFLVYVPSDAQEMSHVVPKISDIFKLSYASDSAVTRGTLRIRNDSSQPIAIRSATGTASERDISGQDSIVMRNRRRDFLVDSGEYILRAVDANEGGYRELARIDDIRIEPGMIYYWFIKEQNSTIDTLVNMNVSRQIKDLFQTWTMDSVAGAEISLRIVSTDRGVRNNQVNLGTTDRNGQLILPSVDIENLIRGLTTDNARRVTLTISAEREGYESASQSISAYTLLTAGQEFRPERFDLKRIPAPAEGAAFTIGDPIIP